ncbi:MAG TPA: transposase [Candidatus Handelsmanbacteria bacterium]|nr:transposase [Candidatus Handelsmanbacteria bacterium]
MGPLPQDIIQFMSHFAPLFSSRVWPHAQVLLTGAILAPGKRTVSALLRVMGLDQQPNFQTYHRVLNRCVWSSLQGSQILLQLLIATFAPQGRLVFGLDDTIERRRGAHIAAKGIYRDPVRSSHSHFVKASGLRWLSLMLLAPVPWADRIWALPFLSVLCPSERYYQARGRSHQTLLHRAQQMLGLLARWVPHRRLVVVADHSFSALAFLDAVRNHVAVVTRLRLDAALYEPAPPRPAGTLGRPRCKGDRLPTLQTCLDDPDTLWQEVVVDRWYATGPHTVHLCSDTAVWYHTGLPPVPIRWLLVKDPDEQMAPQAFLTTDLTLTPLQMLTFFIQRWSVETTFEEARAHLGMETQRQWNDQAIARTTPLVLALLAIVTLIAHKLIKKQGSPIRQAAWYNKTKPTFSDALAWVRKRLWRHFSTSTTYPDRRKIKPRILDRLINIVCYAN